MGAVPRATNCAGEGLRYGFDRLGQVQASQSGLAAEPLRQPGAQAGPVFLRKIEMAAEVGEGDLADAIALALTLDQAVGVVSLPGIGAAGGGTADEHAPKIARVQGFGSSGIDLYGSTFRCPLPGYDKSMGYSMK